MRVRRGIIISAIAALSVAGSVLGGLELAAPATAAASAHAHATTVHAHLDVFFDD